MCSLTDDDGRKIGEKIFKHGGEGLAEMATWMMATSGGVGAPQIHVAIEVPHGPVVETLIERGFKVHAINPKQMDRFRDRFTLGRRQGRQPRRRSDEPRPCAPMRIASDCSPSPIPSSSNCANGRVSPRISVPSATASQTAFASNSGATFRRSSSSKPISHRSGCSICGRPCRRPHKAVRIRETTIAKLLKRHRVRRFDAAQVLDMLRAPPVRVAAGTTEAASAHIATLIARIRLVNQQLKQAHHQLDVLTARLIPTEEAEPGQKSSMTWRSSHPCREWEGSSSPRCSQKPSMLCSDEITPPCAV